MKNQIINTQEKTQNKLVPSLIEADKKPLIELIKVGKKYKDKVILKEIDLKIYEDDRIGIIGSNGAGKTTISEIIGGTKVISSGTIKRATDTILGFQFQASAYPVGITVFDMIKYYLEVFSIPMDESELNQVLERYQISKFKNRSLERLSGGQQQLVNILLSLIHNPDFVILDEISTGLDIEVRSEIFKIIRENIIAQNKGMVLVTHQMQEIEDLCNKFIYIDQGEIKESGEVSKLVDAYGSVENYTMLKLKKSKEKKIVVLSDTRTNNKPAVINPKNRFNKIINSEQNKGKSIPLIKLILKYYYKGIAVPFFLLAFPIILMFLEGFAFKEIYGGLNPQATAKIIKQLTVSVGTVCIIIVGISVLPQTLIEFRNSGLMKRIGSTNTRAINFIISTIGICVIFMILTFLWTLLWSGIMFGWEFGWKEIIAPKQIGESIGYLALIILTSTTFGLMIASLFKSSSPTAYITISNIIFIPTAFLSGSFIPIDLIEKSTILNGFSYLNVFKYTITPLNSSWFGTFEFDLKNTIFFFVSLIIIITFGFISFKKLSWDK
ncbi:ABC transporter ATP-binding protein/permease [Spiroplasma endosymbiont of Panorpa germanica]|uniref:ABC transporter ATP-binding protein/permease n=1 Tax=Spiroplasma endosymbiont of Panorpa germanica TaxID=3066314 RepID=UPI0030CD8B39